ncbi:MAG TPA: acyl-ACP desaturase [Candidatus Binataceae bacterium]|nr:acyl-ACP desaturase [Candidatus Binataceae bacterium]
MISDRVKRTQYYRAAMDFLETAERKRDWKIFDDIPWDKIDPSKNSDQKSIRIETFCAEEMYLPDYASHGARMTRELYGASCFQARWSFEESRHGLVFREYLLRSGMRSEDEIESLEAMVFAGEWVPPFPTVRQMSCYGALQEGATYTAYKAQKERAELEGDLVLKAIFANVASDEAAHAGFYRKLVEIELAADHGATVRDFAHVLANFKMPGDGLIPHYHERLRVGGGGITARQFMEGVVLSTLRSLGITRAELKSGQAHNQALPTTLSAEAAAK